MADEELVARGQPALIHTTGSTAPSNEFGPTFVDDAEPIDVLRAVALCARSWEGGARLLGNVRACDIVRAVEALEALVAAADDLRSWRSALLQAYLRERIATPPAVKMEAL